MSAASSRKVVFGTSQERRLFPLHYAPDRLGTEMSRRLAPHLGPGRYDNHEVGLFKYLKRWNFCYESVDPLHRIFGAEIIVFDATIDVSFANDNNDCTSGKT